MPAGSHSPNPPRRPNGRASETADRARAEQREPGTWLGLSTVYCAEQLHMAMESGANRAGSGPPAGAVGGLLVGAWKTAAAAAAVKLGVFNLIGEGGTRDEKLAVDLGLPARSLQTLLRVLGDLGLVLRRGSELSLSEEARGQLVRGQPGYLGDLLVHNLANFPHWAELAEVLRSGEPPIKLLHTPSPPYWASVGLATLELGFPLARRAADVLCFAQAGKARVLEIAGGTGYFSVTLLEQNPQATALQLDWDNMNALAEELAGKHGVRERLSTKHCNALTEPYGEGAWDLVLYAQMAHGLSRELNVDIFRRARAALKPQGTFVLTDYIRDEASSQFLNLLDLNLLLHSADGHMPTEAECRSMLAEAGFTDVSAHPAGGFSTIFLAR
jgi:SAM-dependent methyltransferase